MENILKYAHQVKADEIFIKIGQVPSLLIRHYKNEIVNLRNLQGFVKTIDKEDYSQFIEQITTISGVKKLQDIFECNVLIGNDAFFRIVTRLDEKGELIMITKRFS